MDKKEIASKIDHTLLKPVSTWQQIKKICDEAIEGGTASVCVPPCYVKRINEEYGNKINICTVVGFPLGYETTAGKIADTKQCLEDGANEIDMVINVCEVKNANFEAVYDEICKLKQLCNDHILKVIIETCYLDESEKIRLCELVTKAGADYIKTSTGFGTAGATLEDIILFRNNIGKNVKIKAAGGIRTVEDAEMYIEYGCSRIGASAVLEKLGL